MNIKRSLISVFTIIIAVVATIVITIETTADASGAAQSTQPPEVEPAEARVVVTGDFVDVNLEQYLREQEQIQAEKRAAEEAAAIEREAQLRRSAQNQAASSYRSSTGSFGGDCASLSAQMNLPESILWRESRCSWAYNPTGCGGRGCLGPAQLDAGHFAEVSPWNSSASGSCSGLNPEIESQYVECVNILSSGGTNLRPWHF